MRISALRPCVSTKMIGWPLQYLFIIASAWCWSTCCVFRLLPCVVIPCEHFDALSVLRAVDAEKCTGIHGVPTMFIAELEHPQFAEFDLGSLRTGIMAGAPCPPALMERVMRDMHCDEILIGYGETEASPLTHITSPNDSIERRINSVGHNLPHQEVKIVDVQSRHTVSLGESGEICFRGYHIMQGYYNDPEATQKTIDPHGWLASGDLGPPWTRMVMFR